MKEFVITAGTVSVNHRYRYVPRYKCGDAVPRSLYRRYTYHRIQTWYRRWLYAANFSCFPGRGDLCKRE